MLISGLILVLVLFYWSSVVKSAKEFGGFCVASCIVVGGIILLLAPFYTDDHKLLVVSANFYAMIICYIIGNNAKDNSKISDIAAITLFALLFLGLPASVLYLWFG